MDFVRMKVWKLSIFLRRMDYFQSIGSKGFFFRKFLEILENINRENWKKWRNLSENIEKYYQKEEILDLILIK